MSPQENKRNSQEAFLFGVPVPGPLASAYRCPNTFAERDVRRRDSDIVQGSDGVFIWTKRVAALVFVGFVIGHMMIPMVATTYVEVGRARQIRTQGENNGR